MAAGTRVRLAIGLPRQGTQGEEWYVWHRRGQERGPHPVRHTVLQTDVINGNETLLVHTARLDAQGESPIPQARGT